MSTPSELDPASLSREVAQLETEAARLEIGRTTAAKGIAILSRRLRYLQLAQWIRRPAKSFPGYRLMLLAAAPLAVAVVSLVLLSAIFVGWTVAFGGFLLTLFSALIGLALLLFHPANDTLAAAIEETRARLESETVRLREATAAFDEVNTRLASLHGHRHALAKSDQLQRAMLLQRNWKSLRGSEWEDFVVEVCRTLGANVQRGEKTGMAAESQGPTTGARGVIRSAPTTLFVTFSPRRVAVAAISDVNPFHAAAVRQLIDALAQKGCDELGIITNARLTAGSREYARSRRCTLIGHEEFPDFVLGKLPL